MTPTGRELLKKLGWAEGEPDEELENEEKRKECVDFLESLGYQVTPPPELRTIPSLEIKTTDLP